MITGFGRLGAPFAAERYGVQPDMITFAKGVTSGTVPMGGVIARKHIYDAFMEWAGAAIELFHGYTYSGHPLACAAALATLDVYRDERLFERAKALEPKWYDASWGSKDCRTSSTSAAWVSPARSILRPSRAALASVFFARSTLVLQRRHHDPPGRRHDRAHPALIVSEDQISEIMEKVGASIKAAA